MRYANRYSLLVTIALIGAKAHAAGIDKGPYLQNPTTDGVTVCWVSDTPCVGAVTYQPVTAAGGGVGRGRVTEHGPARYHRVRLTDLNAYTRYGYRVDCQGSSAEGTFITAALPGQPFRFVAYGDTRSQPDRHAAVLARMVKFRPDFVLQTGDLVASGANEQQWSVFFKTTAALMRDAPYFPELGNHEGDGANYFRYFPVGRSYAFDFGDAHFVALDTNLPTSQLAAQERWLRGDLAAHQLCAWRIVFMHHPLYTCATVSGRRESAQKLRERLEPIFKQGRVQLVFCGHDHDYQHHFANGIHYVVAGGGGAPIYNVKLDTPYVVCAKAAYHHCEVELDANAITVRAVEPNGNVLERFVIKQ